MMPVLLDGSVHAQSPEEVHISPHQDTGKLASVVDAVPGHPALVVPFKPLHVDVNLVLVPVTVTDAMNRSVVSLKEQDFALSEEGKRQAIRYFSEEDAPLSIAVLFDVSKSMSDKISVEHDALVAFFNNANPQDEFFGIAFSYRPRLLAGPGESIDEIERRLVSTERGGATAMLDAIHLAESKLRSARYQRHAILIISDGGDNASRYTLRETTNLIRESDVQIYAIGLFDTFFLHTLEEKLGKQWLTKITDSTGGRTLTVDNGAKVPEAAAQISREMRNQYVLGYQPSNPMAAGWKKIRVQVDSSAAEGPISIHYKKGYIASQQ